QTGSPVLQPRPVAPALPPRPSRTLSRARRAALLPTRCVSFRIPSLVGFHLQLRELPHTPNIASTIKPKLATIVKPRLPADHLCRDTAAVSSTETRRRSGRVRSSRSCQKDNT